MARQDTTNTELFDGSEENNEKSSTHNELSKELGDSDFSGSCTGV